MGPTKLPTVFHKNGAMVWAKVHVSLVRDQHKQPQYFISVVEDVTERKLIEARLQASETRLWEAQRLLLSDRGRCS